MFGSFLANVGGGIGKYFGGGILSTIGRYGGRLLGDYFDNQWINRTKTVHKFTNVKDSFSISTAKYGSPIPLIFGRMKVPGQIIWADRITERRHTSSTHSHFKNKHLTLERQTTELEYFSSFAMAICEGEIVDISRVWHSDELIDLSRYTFRLYKGDEEQFSDPLISAKSNDPSPAYRGLAYIVFEELPLADFNDNIPGFTFEVTRKANVTRDVSVEDLVKSIVMIPGSGEYVYDTKIQEKSVITSFGAVISTTKINSHNHYNIANSVYSLNQLQMTCENIEWVSPVICWFGDNLDANKCIIRPAVEFKEKGLKYSEEWKVGKYDRNTAYEITKDDHQNPIYGGSVNDASVIRYLIELKSRKLKIMFNPMFFLDVPQKPWRGRLTCEAKYISKFFQQEHGYNDFIIHYANLVKDHVDAFIIGSELIGLTKINIANTFPAVDELIKLAHTVKQIVGANVLVSYAADWSEYHHTDGGWFNLDPLWASKDIDFVGIDAYFPVTDSSSSAITPEEIAIGWTKGEGYDYYIDQKNRNIKHRLDPAYAWRNLRYWWENTHKNPDTQNTAWIPKAKPIWFTEFGFPSIDKAPNQPNIFFDPKCIDGGVPRYSNGGIDFSIQRRAIRAFLEYWHTQEYIGQMFLWTWDARPYPAWPHMNIWRDGYLWEKGHWVNNKFGSSSVASIILEISKKCGIDTNRVEVSSVDQPVEGFLLSNRITAIDAINTLRASYFFDINANDRDIIAFVSREHGKEIFVDSSEFLKLSNNSFIEEIDIPKDLTLKEIDFYFINQDDNYSTAYKYINNETSSYASKVTLRLPIAMTESEAQRICQMLLKNSHYEDRILKFILNSFDLKLKPSDFVILNYQNKRYSIRIISIVLQNLQMIVTGIIDDKHSYSKIPFAKNKLNAEFKPTTEAKLIIIDLPFSLSGANTPELYAYFQGISNSPIYAKLSSDTSANWNRITTILPSNSIGTVVSFEQTLEVNIFHIDEENFVLVNADDLDISNSGDWNYAMVGNELICFKYIEKMRTNLYKVSYLTRGAMGTEQYMREHIWGENFILLNSDITTIPISEKLLDQSIDFKCYGCELSIIYQNKAQRPLSPYLTRQELIGQNLFLSWVSRDKDDGNWQFSSIKKSYQFTIMVTTAGQEISFNTDLYEIIIDMKSLDISHGYKVVIIDK